MKVIKYKAKTIDGKHEVTGYYWKEHNNACFGNEYKEHHYLRQQYNFDWGLYEQRDIEIDHRTLEWYVEEEVSHEEE